MKSWTSRSALGAGWQARCCRTAVAPTSRLPAPCNPGPCSLLPHSRAHLLPCSLWALMITASSHWLKGSFFTSGFSWLHHLHGATQGGGVSRVGLEAGRWCIGVLMTMLLHALSVGVLPHAPRLLLLAPHLRRQLLPDRPRMPLAMMDQFLGPYSLMSWRSSSSSCGGSSAGRQRSAGWRGGRWAVGQAAAAQPRRQLDYSDTCHASHLWRPGCTRWVQAGAHGMGGAGHCHHSVPAPSTQRCTQP